MITVRQLLSLPVFQGSEVLAGEKGLDHSVRCVDIAEVPDPLFWLDPGVFILTTAYAFYKEKRLLMSFIESLVKKRAAGLGIKLGRFLDELPREFRCYADKFNLPVILLPLELRYTYAIRSVTETILKDERTEFICSDLNDCFSQLLFGDSANTKDALDTFEAAGFSRSTRAVALLIGETLSGTSVAAAGIAGVLESHGGLFATSKTSSETIILTSAFIFQEYDFSQCTPFFPEGSYATVGGEFRLDEIRRSYDEAMLSMRLLKLFGSPRGIYSKTEMDLFFPFLQGECGDRAMESALRLLEPIIEYDFRNRTSLLKTLWTFVLCDCDHTETSRKLHLHRNSLRYRLVKIRGLLPEGSLKGVAFHRLFLALTVYFSSCASCTR